MIFQLKYKDKNYEVQVDDEDYKTWGKLHPRIIKQKKKFRVILTYGKHRGKNFTNIYLHRYLTKINNPKIHIDHIDGNPLNNTRRNLRICNNIENNYNKPKQCNNKVGYKGVRKHPTAGFTAQLGHKKRQIYIGSFKTAEEAAMAYDLEAIKYHGEFANTNFPLSVYI